MFIAASCVFLVGGVFSCLVWFGVCFVWVVRDLLGLADVSWVLVLLFCRAVLAIC